MSLGAVFVTGGTGRVSAGSRFEVKTVMSAKPRSFIRSLGVVLSSIKFAYRVAEVLDHLGTPYLHGSGQLPLFDGKIAVQDLEFTNLLERGELFVGAGNGFLE